MRRRPPNRGAAAIIAIIMALLAATALAAPRPAIPADLTVMTFNVRTGIAKDGPDAWPQRRPVLLHLLRDQRADVIGTQEATRVQMDEILRALPEYVPVGEAGRDAGLAGRVTILYRAARLRVCEHGLFWFSDTPDVRSATWESTPRACRWARFLDRRSGRTFYVYNVHLSATSGRARNLSAEMLAGRIVARREPRDPVVVTGDLNSTEKSAVVRFLTGELERTGERPGARPPTVRLIDALRTAHPDEEETGTFHGFSGGRAGARIDYVLVDAAFGVTDAEIVRDQIDGRYPSDHYPVVARLRIGAAAPADPDEEAQADEDEDEGTDADQGSGEFVGPPAPGAPAPGSSSGSGSRCTTGSGA